MTLIAINVVTAIVGRLASTASCCATRVSLARVDHMLGRHGGARALLLDALPEADPDSAALLRLELAIDHWHGFEWDRMGDCARAVLESSVGQARPPLRAEALALLALAEQGKGGHPDAVAHAEQAEGIVRRLRDSELAPRLEGCVVLCYLYYALERPMLRLKNLVGPRPAPPGEAIVEPAPAAPPVPPR